MAICRNDAEAGGFEPPVRLPVRQFSKLLVSATHPNFHTGSWFITEAPFLNCECKGSKILFTLQTFLHIFSTKRKVFLHPFIKARLRTSPQKFHKAVKFREIQKKQPTLFFGIKKKPCLCSKEALFAFKRSLVCSTNKASLQNHSFTSARHCHAITPHFGDNT